MSRLVDIALYGGVDLRHFQDVAADLYETERTKTWVLSLVCACLLLGVALYSLAVTGSGAECMSCWCMAVVCMGTFFLSLCIGKRCRAVGRIASYVVMTAMLVTGCAIGAYVAKVDVVALDALLMLSLAILFTDRPVRFCLMLCGMFVVHFVLVNPSATPEAVWEGLCAEMPYCFGALIVSTCLLCLKIQRRSLAKRVEWAETKDGLTGLGNRASYEELVGRLKQEPAVDTDVWAFDINGFNRVNHSLGHEAGNELIRGASCVLVDVFGPYGRLFRTGDNEFVAILDRQRPSIDELQGALREHAAAWHGEQAKRLSLAVGVSTGSCGLTFDAQARQAALSMREDKARFYRLPENDRRRHRLSRDL